MQWFATTTYVIFRELYSIKQLLYTADFIKEVFSGFYPLGEVLVEELYL